MGDPDQASLLPPPGAGVDATRGWVRTHLADLTAEGSGTLSGSPRFRGGQRAADAALAGFDVRGYAGRRNEVWPQDRRGASALSPWIRHGLLPLPRVWEHVAGGPSRDVRKFRDELLWQEFSRHLYARLGPSTGTSLRYAVPEASPTPPGPDEVWDPQMACLDLVSTELARDGWLVNQTRMWLASHWSVRHGWGWREGEDVFFRHLLDGSRAANRLGWQGTVGAGSGRPYGFSRWQVEKRAPGLCEGCGLRRACPIQAWPPEHSPDRLPDPSPLLRVDPRPEVTAGPRFPQVDGDPDVVWLTAESLGDADPALTAYPDLPAVFVFDEPLLRGLRLSGKRLVFLAECLADLAQRRAVSVHRGRPVDVLVGHRPAVTFAPVPGFARRVARLRPAALLPWPWLTPPHGGPVTSFSAWRRAAGV